MSFRLKLLDWLFTRAIGPFEFWTGAYSLVMGFAFVLGQSALQVVTHDKNFILFDWDIQVLGGILIFGGSTQLFALLVVSAFNVQLSRIMRWLGRVSEGSVWALCATFAWMTLSPVNAFKYLYTLLFMQELWVVMSIAYRGFRGKNSN